MDQTGPTRRSRPQQQPLSAVIYFRASFIRAVIQVSISPAVAELSARHQPLSLSLHRESDKSSSPADGSLYGHAGCVMSFDVTATVTRPGWRSMRGATRQRAPVRGVVH